MLDVVARFSYARDAKPISPYQSLCGYQCSSALLPAYLAYDLQVLLRGNMRLQCFSNQFYYE